MRLLFRIRGYTNGVECGTIGNNADYSPQFHRFASKYGRLKMWIWLNWALSNAADMWANFFDWKFIQKSRTAPSAELLLPHRTFQNFTKASLWIQIFVRIEKNHISMQFTSIGMDSDTHCYIFNSTIVCRNITMDCNYIKDTRGPWTATHALI